MIDRLATFWSDESGVAMSEYALILALLSLGLVLAMVIFRDAIGWVFERIGEVLQSKSEGLQGYESTT